MSAGKEGDEWEELAVCYPLALGSPPGTSEWPERDEAGVPTLCKPGGGGEWILAMNRVSVCLNFRCSEG